MRDTVCKLGDSTWEGMVRLQDALAAFLKSTPQCANCSAVAFEHLEHFTAAMAKEVAEQISKVSTIPLPFVFPAYRWSLKGFAPNFTVNYAQGPCFVVFLYAQDSASVSDEGVPCRIVSSKRPHYALFHEVNCHAQYFTDLSLRTEVDSLVLTASLSL